MVRNTRVNWLNSVGKDGSQWNMKQISTIYVFNTSPSIRISTTIFLFFPTLRLSTVKLPIYFMLPCLNFQWWRDNCSLKTRQLDYVFIEIRLYSTSAHSFSSQKQFNVITICQSNNLCPPNLKFNYSGTFL